MRVPRVRLPSRPTAKMSVRLRATLAATAIVAVALGGASAVLVGVLRGSLQDSAEIEATRRAAVTADLLAAGVPGLPPPGSPRRPGESGSVTTIAPDVLVVGDPAAPKALLAVAPGDPAATWAPPAPTRWPCSRSRPPAARCWCRPGRRSSRPPPRSRRCRPCCCRASPRCSCWSPASPGSPSGGPCAPVSAIRRELADITASDLHRRVPIPPARDEITRLAETTNQTLDRLERAVGRHRQVRRRRRPRAAQPARRAAHPAGGGAARSRSRSRRSPTSTGSSA